jgi:hypothetical protein
MMLKFKNIMVYVRLLLVACLFIAMALNVYARDYGMAIVDLLLIIIFELQDLNDKFKL